MVGCGWLCWLSLVVAGAGCGGAVANVIGARGHVQKSQNRRNEGVEDSRISKSKSYKFKLKQNNTTKLLNIYVP